MPRGYPHLVGTSHLGQQVRHDLALPRSTSTTLYQAVALPSFPLVKCTSTARSIACTAHSTAIRIPGPDHPRYFQHSCPSPCLDFGKAGTLPASQITGASTLAGLCNSLRVRGQISIQGPVHICFRPFTIPALHTSKPGSHLLQEAQSPHCSSLLSACLASTTPGNACVSTRSASPAYPQILSIRRQISILAEAATIEYHSTPHRFIWQTAAEPCKLHPDCVLTLCSRLTDGSVATSETYPHRLRRRQQVEPARRRVRSPYLPVPSFQIRDSRSVERAARSKAQQWA